MKRNASGVVQCASTTGEGPTTATTVDSSPAVWIADRKNGNVSMRPLRSSTSSRSWWSHPAWFSSEPRWWSIANSAVADRRAASPSQIVERPQYEPTSTNGAPGTSPAAAIAAACNASPSSSGMKPLVVSATARTAGSSTAGSSTASPYGRPRGEGHGSMAWMSDALDELIALLDLERIEVNLFRGVSPNLDMQRVFGGQVAGQALVAAS